MENVTPTIWLTFANFDAVPKLVRLENLIYVFGSSCGLLIEPHRLCCFDTPYCASTGWPKDGKYYKQMNNSENK